MSSLYTVEEKGSIWGLFEKINFEDTVRTNIQRIIEKSNVSELKTYLESFSVSVHDKISEIIVNKYYIPNYCPLIHAIELDNLDILKELLAYTGKHVINIDGYHRDTPLMAAIRNSSALIVKYLLSINASTCIEDRWKYSPLAIALDQKNINMEIVKALLDAKANVNVGYDSCQESRRMRRNPFVIALEKNNTELLVLLIEYGLGKKRVFEDLQYLQDQYPDDKIHRTNTMQLIKNHPKFKN
jgi:ankyrin repeat protein